MQFFYNIITHIATFFVFLSTLFSSKMRLFYKGRKATFPKLKKAISENDQTIWMHCASLGEFEQGRPVFEKLKRQYPNYKLVLSFFSPSGYEVQKEYKHADVVVYLPLDTQKNAIRFIKAVHPSLAIFVKYEFWPNMLKELQRRHIHTVLISGIFRKSQIFFQERGKWYRNSLKAFTHFFVQNDDSVKLLKSIGYHNVTQSGDTRFDRVFELVKQRKELVLIDSFSENSHVLVAGSTWPKDEDLLVEYINLHSSNKEKFILVPHNINKAAIEKLARRIRANTVLYSRANTKNIRDAKILIIDSIGLLTSVYSCADVAYVGGGFGSGIHNILEPATYGIPIIIGPNYQKFQEALDLIEQKACVEVQSIDALTQRLQEFNSNKKLVKSAGKIASDYVFKNIGATDKILLFVKKVLNKRHL